MDALLITKDAWQDSQLSIVRYTYCIRIDGREYMLMGNVQDLVCKDIMRAYVTFGRDQIIAWLKDGQTAEQIAAHAIPKKVRQQQPVQLTLF